MADAPTLNSVRIEPLPLGREQGKEQVREERKESAKTDLKKADQTATTQFNKEIVDSAKLKAKTAEAFGLLREARDQIHKALATLEPSYVPKSDIGQENAEPTAANLSPGGEEPSTADLRATQQVNDTSGAPESSPFTAAEHQAPEVPSNQRLQDLGTRLQTVATALTSTNPQALAMALKQNGDPKLAQALLNATGNVATDAKELILVLKQSIANADPTNTEQVAKLTQAVESVEALVKTLTENPTEPSTEKNVAVSDKSLFAKDGAKTKILVCTDKAQAGQCENYEKAVTTQKTLAALCAPPSEAKTETKTATLTPDLSAFLKGSGSDTAGRDQGSRGNKADLMALARLDEDGGCRPSQTRGFYVKMRG
jgi:hypothetical protein